MSSETFGSSPLTRLRALLLGAAAVGGIDFLYATIFVVAKGRPWIRPWQGVASALLGADSFQGGYRTALFGIVLHFLVAMCIVAVYLIASRRIPILRRQTVPCGMVFGVIAFFVMNLVIVPRTHIGSHPLVWTPFNIGGLLLHMLLLGPAAAYFGGRVAWPQGRPS